MSGLKFAFLLSMIYGSGLKEIYLWFYFVLSTLLITIGLIFSLLVVCLAFKAIYIIVRSPNSLLSSETQLDLTKYHK